MATTRTSSRQAAQKAKEAITSTAEPTGTKRKGAADKAPEPKKGKKEDQEIKEEKAEQETKEPIKEDPTDGAGTVLYIYTMRYF